MKFEIGTLDRRKLFILVAGLVLLTVVLVRQTRDSSSTPVVASADSIPLAERRLERLRQVAATVPGKETVLQQARAELQGREAGILKADTAPQAQAQLMDVIRRVAAANGIDARGAEELRVRPLANDYGEVLVAVTFTCGIEQLVNFLAGLANESQIIATDEINISGGTDKKKAVQVRLSLSGLVPKKLIPAKRAVGVF
ncbi:MAG TPA: type II secretion system protein GspM [Bryobacteraceae bacterium]|nr:type II secretion system protein GspM [Bryobacteraceae bacterium]